MAVGFVVVGAKARGDINEGGPGVVRQVCEEFRRDADKWSTGMEVCQGR